MQDASRTIPLVLCWAVASNALMLLIVGWTYVFCLGDLKSVLNTDTYQPMIQVFFNATGSHAGTTVMVVVVLIILLSACVGQVATASRQMWSFARDGGKPQLRSTATLRARADPWTCQAFPAPGISRWFRPIGTSPSARSSCRPSSRLYCP